MKLRSKWVLFFFSLFILVLLLQSGFHHFFKASLILSSFLALCLMTPLLLLLVKSLVSPVLTLTRKAKDLAAGRGTQEVFSGDEWEDLARAILEVSAQSRERIEEITREKEYLQAILGGMTEGVLLMDGRGRTLLANEALKRLIAIPTNVNDKTTLEIIRSVTLEEAVQVSISLCRKVPRRSRGSFRYHSLSRVLKSVTGLGFLSPEAGSDMPISSGTGNCRS